MKKSFTLIELLVVIAIIGILATLIVANMSSARAKARDARRKSDLDSIRTAIEMFSDVYNAPPVPGLAAGSLPTATVTANSTQSTWTGTSATNELRDHLAPYLPTLPKDVRNTGNFIYRYAVDPNGYYELDATLEVDTASMLNTNDGGNNDNKYEIGTDPGLDLLGT